MVIECHSKLLIVSTVLGYSTQTHTHMQMLWSLVIFPLGNVLINYKCQSDSHKADGEGKVLLQSSAVICGWHGGAVWGEGHSVLQMENFENI